MDNPKENKLGGSKRKFAVFQAPAKRQTMPSDHEAKPFRSCCEVCNIRQNIKVTDPSTKYVYPKRDVENLKFELGRRCPLTIQELLLPVPEAEYSGAPTENKP